MRILGRRWHLGCTLHYTLLHKGGGDHGHRCSSRQFQDMETDEQPLLNRFGYRPDDLPLEIRGGYRGVGERWKPDVPRRDAIQETSSSDMCSHVVFDLRLASF